MPGVSFWKERFDNLGIHSVGPGSTQTEAELEDHRQVFVRPLCPWLKKLEGPVLDFGCGVGRWVMDLPRPYVGLDLLPEHVEVGRQRFYNLPDVEFRLASELSSLPDKHFSSIFTCTVLQHVVEPDQRREIIRHFQRILTDDGVLLSIEWAEGQREYDWCTAVSKDDFRRYFDMRIVGEVVEQGRRSSAWIGKKKSRGFFIGLSTTLRSPWK